MGKQRVVFPANISCGFKTASDSVQAKVQVICALSLPTPHKRTFLAPLDSLVVFEFVTKFRPVSSQLITSSGGTLLELIAVDNILTYLSTFSSKDVEFSLAFVVGLLLFRSCLLQTQYAQL